MKAIRNTLAGTALFALLSSAAFADSLGIDNIEVEMSIDAAQTSNAPDYWPNLAADLDARLTEQLINFVVPEGTDNAVHLDVTIEEISLNGVATLTGDGTFNRLRGTVNINSPEGINNEVFALDVQVTADMPAVVGEGVVIIAPVTENVYDSALDAFAGRVAEIVATIDPS